MYEADCSHPSSGKIKNVCCYTSVLLHMFMMCTGTHTALCGCEPRSVTLRDDVRACTGDVEVRYLLYLCCNNCRGHLHSYSVTGESPTGAR